MDSEQKLARLSEQEILQIVGLESWSNAACRGYAIRACELAGIDHETMDRIICMFRVCFEELTVKEAEKVYYEY